MPKLVNLGSLCVDNVYRVTHLAGPGETVASHGHQVFAGGKGLNQSLAAARAGARVVHVGCVGADGELLTRTLRDAGVDTDCVRAVADQATGHAVIQVDDAGQNAIVIAGGANRCLSAADVRHAMDRVEPGDWLLLQNEINDLPRILEMAARQEIQLAFNVAPADDRVTDYDLSAVDLLVVNGLEARALVPTAIRNGSDLDVAGWLARRYPRADVVVTAGDQGLIHANHERAAHLPAFAVRAVDETGAGDAFTGYLLAGLLSGLGFTESLRLGAAAGALAVTLPGAASSIPHADAVRGLLQAGSALSGGV